MQSYHKPICDFGNYQSEGDYVQSRMLLEDLLLTFAGDNVGWHDR